ncbi:hypothetical protein SeLEV6574_g06886 [Synchytrium endobioticum]|uniref:Uncharacterized protein n=1 Tax=Synchytrium endobioticum TaxID=286115 RepID=A0A507CMJ8_9FUNG|nr:hypothetical protein SeLEV6574_g08396 [Synchytrium endobioticum]TPX39975.1 hypothetical protein SeLEV6574_g06886 [Synchytrium endobioticum]
MYYPTLSTAGVGTVCHIVPSSCTREGRGTDPKTVRKVPEATQSRQRIESDYTVNHLGEAVLQSILYNFLILLPLLKNNLYDACNPLCNPKKDLSFGEEDPQKTFQRQELKQTKERLSLAMEFKRFTGC